VEIARDARGEDLRHTDVRVVAATHRDLRAVVVDGRFRADLYHRLAAIPIHVPALPERANDIPLLAAALLTRAAPGRARRFGPPAGHQRTLAVPQAAPTG
jgi:transcriptional regulator with GAF, ATPase, and Fis domain